MTTRNKKKALFLDRDGVINRYPGDREYVTSWERFRFLPGAKKALSELSKKYDLFVVSNQAGVGKGVYHQRELDRITENMLKAVKREGGAIKQVFYCTHRQEENCGCRKPKAGLLTLARKKYRLNLKDSFFVGDTIRDIETARNAGCKSILVLSGKEKLPGKRDWQLQPDFVFKNLKSAADFLLKKR